MKITHLVRILNMWTGLRWVQFRWKASDSENTFFHVHCLSEPNWFSQVYRFTLQNGAYEGRRGGGVGGGEEEVLLTPEFFIQASLFVMFLLPFNNEDLLVQQTSTTGQKGQYSHI